MDKTWKAVERRVAAFLGGRRIGATKGRSQPDVDQVPGNILVEVKHCRQLPAWLLGALAQVQAHVGDDQIGIAVLHQRRQRVEDCLAVLRLEDLKRLIEPFGKGHEDNAGPNGTEPACKGVIP